MTNCDAIGCLRRAITIKYMMTEMSEDPPQHNIIFLCGLHQTNFSISNLQIIPTNMCARCGLQSYVNVIRGFDAPEVNKMCMRCITDFNDIVTFHVELNYISNPFTNTNSIISNRISNQIDMDKRMVDLK